jgi:hypothetical protein
MENEKIESRIPMILAGVLTTVVTIGLVVLLLWPAISSDTAANPGTTETTETTAPEIAPAPPISINTPETEDAATVAWNEEMGPLIQRVISDVTAPPVSSIKLLRIKCARIENAVGQIKTKPKAPKTDVAEAFDTWALFVEDAVVYCLEGSTNLSDEQALTTAGGNLVSTMAYFDTFISVVSNYVDLTKVPSNAPTQVSP